MSKEEGVLNIYSGTHQVSDDLYLDWLSDGECLTIAQGFSFGTTSENLNVYFRGCRTTAELVDLTWDYHSPDLEDTFYLQNQTLTELSKQEQKIIIASLNLKRKNMCVLKEC